MRRGRPHSYPGLARAGARDSAADVQGHPHRRPDRPAAARAWCVAARATGFAAAARVLLQGPERGA